MKLTQKIRIFPTKEQEEILWILSEKCRLIYNFALTERIDSWKNKGEYVSYFKQQNDLPKMFEKYEQKIEVKILDVLNQEEYLLWNRFSEKLNYSDPLLPTVVIDDVMLSGLDEIETRLEAEIDRILKEGGCEFPVIETEEEPTEVTEETTKVTEEAKELYIAYFYQPGCKKCGSVFYLLNQLKDRYANLVVKEYDTLDSKNIKLFESLCERNGVEKENWLL